MLFQIKTINGQKTIVPLTADTGTGAPVGSLISQYKKVPMSGYLYCDGSTFDETAYPALYLYLGSNVLPDYRECVMVGAEQNTTDSIATHDVYTQGQFKDDQLQSHNHGTVKVNGVADFGVIGDPSWSESSVYSVSIAGGSNNTISLSAGSNTGRSGTTTHGKQKAVFVYIKATSGLAENQQENVLNATKDYVDNKFTKVPVTIGNSGYFEKTAGSAWIENDKLYIVATFNCIQSPSSSLNNVCTLSTSRSLLLDNEAVGGSLQTGAKNNDNVIAIRCFTFDTYQVGNSLFINGVLHLQPEA